MKRKILKNSIYSLVSAISSRVSVISFGIIVANILGPEEFGRYAILQSVLLIVGNNTAFAFLTAASKSSIEKNGVVWCDFARGGLSILLWIASFAVLVLFLLSLFNKNYYNENLSFLLLAIAIVMTLSGWGQGVLQAAEFLRPIWMASIFSSIISIILCFFWVKSYGVLGALWAQLVHQLFYFGLIVLFGFSKIRNSIIVSNKKWFDTAKDTLAPVFLSGLIVAPASFLVLSIIREKSLLLVGIFSVVMQINVIVSQISQIIGNAILPILSRSKDNVGLDKINIIAGYIPSFMVVCPFIFFPETIVFLYGEKYMHEDIGAAMGFLLVAALIVSFKGGVGRKITSRGLSWFSFWSGLGWCVSYVVLVDSLVFLDLFGVSFAFLVSHVIAFLFGYKFFVKNGLLNKSHMIESGFLPTVFLLLFFIFMRQNAEKFDKVILFAFFAAVFLGGIFVQAKFLGIFDKGNK